MVEKAANPILHEIKIRDVKYKKTTFSFTDPLQAFKEQLE